VHVLTINGSRFELPTESALDVLKRTVAAAIEAGGRIVDVRTYDHRNVRVMVTPSSAIQMEYESHAYSAMPVTDLNTFDWIDDL